MTLVKYGAHDLQEMKFFLYSPENTKTVVFIHGGAWNDTANSYDDFEQLAALLATLMPDLNTISVNYRLSPGVKHPYHLADVGSALSMLVTEYKITNVTLVGHSVGATLALQLLSYDKLIRAGIENLERCVCKTLPIDLGGIMKGLQQLSIDTLVLVDGIFDIPDMISEYGEPYERFVGLAFVSPEHYTEATQVSSSTGTLYGCKLRVVVVHSTEDELLLLRQPSQLRAFLEREGYPFEWRVGAFGKHEEVYRRVEVASIIEEVF